MRRPRQRLANEVSSSCRPPEMEPAQTQWRGSKVPRLLAPPTPRDLACGNSGAVRPRLVGHPPQPACTHPSSILRDVRSDGVGVAARSAPARSTWPSPRSACQAWPRRQPARWRRGPAGRRRSRPASRRSRGRSATSLRLTPEWPLTHRNFTLGESPRLTAPTGPGWRPAPFLAGLPAVGLPLAPPFLLEAVDDVLRVRPHRQRPGAERGRPPAPRGSRIRWFVVDGSSAEAEGAGVDHPSPRRLGLRGLQRFAGASLCTPPSPWAASSRDLGLERRLLAPRRARSPSPDCLTERRACHPSAERGPASASARGA